jgi:energy-coupling factor transporter transmembrane protein EcfT
MAWIERRTRWMRLPLKHRISVMLVLMALMTISRGPWIGGIVGALIAGVGLAEKRGRRLALVVSVLLVAGTAGKLALDAYITPAVGEKLSGEAQTMLYRKVMVEQYQAFLFQHPWFGWGLTTVPKIRGMESIDNAFFLMALQHGSLAVAVFGLIFVYAIVTQIRFGLAAPPGEPPLGFTFSGIYLMCAIAFATVYMGSQTEPMLFLLLGWGEGIKQRGHSLPTQTDQAVAQAGPAPPFRRIMH